MKRTLWIGGLLLLSLLAGCGGGGGGALLKNGPIRTGPGGNSAPTYNVIDLGALPYYPGEINGDYRSGFTLQVNSSAQVAGSGADRADFWSNGTPTFLAKAYSSANAINDAGQVAGTAPASGSQYDWPDDAYVWQ
ncbi:MAG TPA: hypothetical protein VGS41_00020, partial [Chthonomonadales bacterium]|nr:hypothetical protein [Chthonomonadales bacterium]